MGNRTALTSAELREWLEYDQTSGVFTWRVNRLGGVKAGDVAGTSHGNGYRSIGLHGSHHFAHRLAWLYVTGSWPTGSIDHINGDRADNRFSNLRAAKRSINQENQRRARADSRGGVLGVTFHKRAGKYMAQIVVHGKRRYLGLHESAEQAHQVYLTAKRRLHEGCTL